MKANEIMSYGLQVIHPDTTIKQAAQIMSDTNFGALPIAQNSDILGIITDRDLVVRAMAKGLDFDKTPVSEIMTAEVFTRSADADLESIVELMEQEQVRRVIITDEQDQAVGLISIDDLAIRSFDKSLASRALHKKSKFSEIVASSC